MRIFALSLLLSLFLNTAYADVLPAGPVRTDITAISGNAASATNALATRLSNGTSFYDARDRNWALAFGTDSTTSYEGGTWNITNITGTISLPTGAATSAKQDTGNTSLATIVSQTVGLATSALQSAANTILNTISSTLTTINTTLGSPFQAGGSIGNTSFGATQSTASALNATTVTTGGATIAKDSSLSTINSTLGSPFQVGGSIGNTAFAINAGTALIGKVGIDQTTPGTTNKVSIGSDGVVAGTGNFNAVQSTASNLNATTVTTGGATIGKDSTLSSILSALGSPFQAGGSIANTAFALNAGSALVGKVGIDQTTPGTTNKVSIGTDGTVDVIPGNTAASPGTVSVTTTATLMSASDITYRIRYFYNGGAVTIYYGFDNTVTAANGQPVSSGGTYIEDKYTGAVYGIVAVGTATVRVQAGKK